MQRARHIRRGGGYDKGWSIRERTCIETSAARCRAVHGGRGGADKSKVGVDLLALKALAISERHKASAFCPSVTVFTSETV